MSLFTRAPGFQLEYNFEIVYYIGNIVSGGFQMVNNSVVLGMWDGRVGRMQYIFNYLFLIVISTVGLSIAGVLIGVAGNVGLIIGSILAVIFGLLYFLFAVSLILRRLHDFGQSGLWLLLYLLPFLGFLMSIILLVVAGDPGPNRYGAVNDRGIGASSLFGK